MKISHPLSGGGPSQPGGGPPYFLCPFSYHGKKKKNCLNADFKHGYDQPLMRNEICGTLRYQSAWGKHPPSSQGATFMDSRKGNTSVHWLSHCRICAQSIQVTVLVKDLICTYLSFSKKHASVPWVRDCCHNSDVWSGDKHLPGQCWGRGDTWLARNFFVQVLVLAPKNTRRDDKPIFPLSLCLS